MKRIISCIALLLLLDAAHAQLNKEQKTIQQVFFSFLKFYKANEKKFNSFVLYKGKGKDNSPPYHIQWKEAEKYFSYLRSSVPYVGEAYIRAERDHFKYYDSCFKADPAEEMPVGFDFDRWAGGQEDIAYTLKWYTSPKNKYSVTITGNTAVLKIGGELWEGATEKDRSWNIVPFTKEKGKWVMADNIYPAETAEADQ
ncbi:MAG: hypothetical protein U0V75_03055 [Ferruginibacter sp.]